MIFPEDIEQIFVRELCRIEVNFYSLSVISKVVVGRILFCSSRIANTSADYTGNDAEPGVRSPESTQSKCGSLSSVRRSLIYRGDLLCRRLMCHIHKLPLDSKKS
jgi:hypothetical protein